MKRLAALLIMLVLICGQLVGCNSANKEAEKAGENSTEEASQVQEDEKEIEEAQEGTTRLVVDALGREVEVPAKIERIVPLGNTPRMITYLGLADKVVGIGSFDFENLTSVTAFAYVNKDIWKDLPVVGTDAKGNTDYYPEEIIATNPDVILCTYAEDIVKDIEAKTGLPVVAVSSGKLFAEDYDESFKILGQVCGVEDRAEEVVNYIHTCFDDLNNRTVDIPEEEKPSVISAAATFKGVHGIEGVRMSDAILEAVNAKNIAKGEKGPEVAIVDREQILAWNPDYIFCDFGGVKLVKEDYRTDEAFYKELKSFQDNHMFQHPNSTSRYSNLEIPLVNAYYIGSVLYPEKFEDVDINEKAKEIFKFFLNKEDYLTELEGDGAFYGPIDFSK